MNRRPDEAAAPHFWDDNVLVREFLATQLQKRRLTLVLGAGVSQGLKLPGWEELADRLYASKGSRYDKSKSAEVAADEFQAAHHPNDLAGFANAVRTALYQTLPPAMRSSGNNPLLNALGALMTASSRGSVPSAITFNFDDLLETHLEDRGFVVRSISRLPAWHSMADVTILHIHGILPMEDDRERSEKIVFTKSDFVKVIGNTEDLWNQRMLDVLRSNTCVFLGLSGADQRLMTLLEKAKSSHVSLEGHHYYWGVRPRMVTDPLAEEWEQRGVASSIVADYDDFPEWLMKICRLAARRQLVDRLARVGRPS